MSTQYDPTTFGYQNFYSGLLTADITSGSLTISLDNVPSATSGILVIDPDSTTNREVIFYTSKGASTITTPSDGRGWAGTSAVAHLTGTTVIMADVAQYFAGLSDGTLSSDPLRTSLFFDYIVSGGVVALSSGLVGTFSNIIFYLNGRRYSGTSIANKTYTASKDTYVDITGNSDGTVTVAYNEVANNAASPALTTNYIRVAIVTTSGSAITNVNQGQETQVIPIASSIPYAVTDSLGNLIYPTDPVRRTLGYRQILGTATGTTQSDIAGLTVPVIVPAGRKVKISFDCQSMSCTSATGGGTYSLYIMEGATQLSIASITSVGNGFTNNMHREVEITPSAGSHTYKIQAAATLTYAVNAASNSPTFIKVELV